MGLTDNKDNASTKHKKRHRSPSPVRHHHYSDQKDSTLLVPSLFSGGQDITKPPATSEPVSSVPAGCGLELHRLWLSPLQVMVDLLLLMVLSPVKMSHLNLPVQKFPRSLKNSSGSLFPFHLPVHWKLMVFLYQRLMIPQIIPVVCLN